MSYLTPDSVLKMLLDLRTKNERLRTLKYLTDKIIDFDGSESPLSPRPYQVQGALSLYLAPRMVLGDSCGLGKTLQAIISFCCIWETEPTKKVIIASCKSSVPQWEDEFVKFTRGVKTFRVSDLPSLSELKVKLYSTKDKSKLDLDFGYLRDNQNRDLWDSPLYPELCYLYKKTKKGENQERLAGIIRDLIIRNQSLTQGFPDLADQTDIDFINGIRGLYPKMPKKFFTDKKRNLSVKYSIPFYDAKFWNNRNNLKLLYILELANEQQNYEDTSICEIILKKLSKAEPIFQDEIERMRNIFRKYRMLPTDTQNLRLKDYHAFLEYEDGPAVLILTYSKITMDSELLLTNLSGIPFVFACDECTAFKGLETDVHLACANLSRAADKCFGLTATLIKNNLSEGYAIYNVIVPGLFGDYNDFLVNYCKVFIQTLGNKHVVKIAGHTDKHIEKFSEVINPYYLGRLKYEVANDLPSIISKDIYVDMELDQLKIYAEALSGMLRVGEGATAVAKKVSKLTEVIFCQQIVDHPLLIDRKGSSAKLDTLIDLLCEGELKNEKVVIYTRFREMLPIFDEVFSDVFKYTFIHGGMDETARNVAKNEFQNNPEVKKIFITDAASQAVNLQSASAIIYFDIPFSGGNYLQILGRTDRIGSKYDNIYAIHLIARGSIDETILKIVRGKIKTIEKTIGTQIKRSSDFQMDDANLTIDKIYNDLVNSAENVNNLVKSKTHSS